ncbi:hypothetical protein TRIP_E280188 [uncultured Spirochaetota bacterium]|nr:hypothetical protein TRIP_E280188 [uncultured Spirochaetota bacterium]
MGARVDRHGRRENVGVRSGGRHEHEIDGKKDYQDGEPEDNMGEGSGGFSLLYHGNLPFSK